MINNNTEILILFNMHINTVKHSWFLETIDQLTN